VHITQVRNPSVLLTRTTQSLNNRRVIGLERDSNNMFREVPSVIRVSFVRFRPVVVELHQVENT